MAEFTPGPWKLGIDTQYDIGALCVIADPKHKQAGVEGPGACVCRVAPYDHTTTIDEANANLIAAAPDLYEACLSVLQAHDAQVPSGAPGIDGRRCVCPQCKRIIAALDKAVGE